MVALPIKFYEDTPYNFVVNSNQYDIHVGMLYKDSLVIDLDQYDKIFSLNMINHTDVVYDDKTKFSILPFSLLIRSFANVNHPFLDYFIASSYALYSLEFSGKKAGSKVNIKVDRPLVLFIFRDINNRLWKIISTRYNLNLVDIGNVYSEKLVNIKLNKGSCEYRHNFLSTKTYRPFMCPICYANGMSSKVVTYDETLYPVYRLRIYSKEYGDVIVYVPKDLWDFYKEVRLPARLAIMSLFDVPFSSRYFGNRVYDAYFAIGLYFDILHKYDPFVIEDFYSYSIDEKIYLLIGGGPDNILVSLPTLFTLFDNFSVMFVNLSDKYIRSLHEIYNGFREASTVNDLFLYHNILVRDIQYAPYNFRKRVLDFIKKKNIVIVYRLTRELFRKNVITFNDLINLFKYYRVHFQDYVDFIVFANEVFRYDGTRNSIFRDVSNYVSRLLRSVNIDDKNFDKYFNVELNFVYNIYRDFADYLYTRKDTILKMSRIFTILDRSNVVEHKHVRYAVAYFSLIHLLPFYGIGTGVLKLFDRYRNELGVFYNKYLSGVEEIPAITGIDGLKELILSVLSDKKMTYRDIVRILTDMVLSGRVRYLMRDLRFQDAVSMALNELMAEKKIKYQDGTYSL